MATPLGILFAMSTLWLSGSALAAPHDELESEQDAWRYADELPLDTGFSALSPGSQNDRDGDGFSPAEGDCMDDPSDSDSVNVHPGAVELCDDLLDNDCNGLFNDGCESPVAYGSVQGGGCSVVSEPSAPYALTLAMAFVLVGGTVRRRGDA